MIREVDEEIGLSIIKEETKEIFSGTEYSKNGTHYSLFITHFSKRPQIVMSWEHSSYEWISKEDFINKAEKANDTYMHMVGDVLGSLRGL
jgi:8-oxo-dGTP pyrophosphatase MutT (NUDIX family)